MDTITLAGPLAAKLRAMRDAGFGQVMLKASDLVSHPEGVDDAVRVVKASGLRVTGFQVLRDFEGLTGHLHGYRVDMAKSMIEMCRALGSPLLLACSSTSQHASGELDHVARDQIAHEARPPRSHPDQSQSRRDAVPRGGRQRDSPCRWC